MTLLKHALRAGRSGMPASGAAASTVLVAGGGGALGAAVLEAVLSRRQFAQVRVLVTRPLNAAVQGLEAIVVEDVEDVEDGPAPAAPPIADAALIVFDRERHANGRELAFLRPAPDALAARGAWLHRRGVRALIVVLPHSPAGLPAALKAGLANLDEQAVAALGFEHLVFVRTAQPPVDARAQQWLQRVADGLLAQMRLMVASPDQPVRAAKVARFVAELAARIGASANGTRVAPPELVWQAAQMRDPAALVEAWLAARELPPISAPRARW